MSSAVVPWLVEWRFIDSKLVLEGTLFIERTTSPLQMGQVRRRVVNHGVLYLR